MGERNIQLFTPDGKLFSEGAPLIVDDGALLRDRRSGKKFVRLRLKNISHKAITAATVTVRALDGSGDSPWGDIVCAIDGLNIPRDGEFGQDRTFDLLDGDVASFAVYIDYVAFTDGTVWHGEAVPWTPLPHKRTLEDWLGSDELAAQFRILYGSDCDYQPLSERGTWFCTCGGINRDNEVKCHLCRRTLTAQKAVNIASLKAECALRLKNEQEEHEALSSEASLKKKKNLRRAVIIAPIALLLVLLIAVLPGYMAEQQAYKEAEALLSAGMYDQAAVAFWELGIYGDSREQAEKNVPYQKALYILDCADNASTPGLTLIGMKRSQFEDDEHMRMALYQGAAELFKSLDGYKDSDEKQAYALEEYAALVEKLSSDAYAEAEELLSDGAYLAARDAFLALGSYRDSADRSVDCIYLKATALLEFVEKYSVRGVEAILSDTAGTPDVIRVSLDAMGRLGESSTGILRDICDGDGVDFASQDDMVEGLQPLCACIEQLFVSLDDYKDSAALAERAKLAGDFTRPFYELCSTGDVAGAIKWLQAYDGEVPDRDGWLTSLNIYLPFCRSWELYRGDSTLIPLTVEAAGICGEFTAIVIFDSERNPTLRISFGDDGKYVDLTAERDSVEFTASYDDYSFYYVALNNHGRFTYIKYDKSVTIISSVEYSAK